MNKRATVIIPTFDHGPLIEYALKSVCQQTIKDIEIFVIGDGAPNITHEIMEKWMAKDQRIQYFSFPKDSRTGEIYRHQVITQHAQGNIICYASDDDLWFPNHLEVMEQLLSEADFAHTLPVIGSPSGEWDVLRIDLAMPVYREWVLNVESRTPISCTGHTRALYDRLPYGWRTSPRGVYTDLYMYRQILATPGVVAKSGFQVTTLYFPSSWRKNLTAEERLAELAHYDALLASDEARRVWQDQLFCRLAQSAVLAEPLAAPTQQSIAALQKKLSDIEQTKWWRLRANILRYFPMLRAVLAKS